MRFLNMSLHHHFRTTDQTD